VTESQRKKVLVIRFNSIGDLVLTTPTIKALSQHGYAVHFLVKEVFAPMLRSNPYLAQVWTLGDSLSEVIGNLKNEKFDLVIDLHNNYRSKKVISALSLPNYRLKKDRVKLWLLTNLSINKISERLDIVVEDPKTEFFIDQQCQIPTELPNKFLAIAVGAAWFTKEIPIDKLIDLIDQTRWENIVLIGGPADKLKANLLIEGTNKELINLVGQQSIEESAKVIDQAAVLLTGDTGMMHIAASLGTNIVAVFGSTHPILGYTPFASETKYSLFQNHNLRCRPCTKQGKEACPKGHFKCMLDLDYQELVYKLDLYI